MRIPPSLRAKRSNPVRSRSPGLLRRFAPRNDVAIALLLVLAPATPAYADSALPTAEYAYKQLDDPKQEARAKALMESLRCLVCQGQSIADSDAEMAGDMRAEVRRRIAAGEKPGDIRSWFVSRYGNWVSYDPPVEPVTWPLWVAPILLLAAGAWLAHGRFRRKPS